MLQVIVRYYPKNITDEAVYKLGTASRRFIAEAASTKQVPLTIHDIEWIPQPYGPGAIASDLGIEIRTIGSPERKAKLNEQVVLDLKKNLLEAGFDVYTSDNKLLIRIQFTDPDDCHV
jgi:hypothetical protein